MKPNHTFLSPVSPVFNTEETVNIVFNILIQKIEQNIIKVIIYGDLHPLPEVVRHPHFEVPYPIPNGDNNI